MWGSLVNTLQAIIFTLGHFAGSLGAGIFATAFLLRVALLPLSLRLARRARRQQEKLGLIQPHLQRLQAKWKSDPVRLQRETLQLFRDEGYSPVDGKSLLGTLAQWPAVSAMFAALRRGVGAGIGFGWVADLARPDLPLIILSALLTAGGAYFGASASASRNSWLVGAAIAGGMTVAFLLFNSSAMALSVAANGVVGIGQNWWLRREQRRGAVR